jgi:hypothetical protein
VSCAGWHALTAIFRPLRPHHRRLVMRCS